MVYTVDISIIIIFKLPACLVVRLNLSMFHFGRHDFIRRTPRDIMEKVPLLR